MWQMQYKKLQDALDRGEGKQVLANVLTSSGLASFLACVLASVLACFLASVFTNVLASICMS